MELYVPLEFLKSLWLGFETACYSINRKREKTLIAKLEEYNQCLEKLEKAKET